MELDRLRNLKETQGVEKLWRKELSDDVREVFEVVTKILDKEGDEKCQQLLKVA